MVQLWWSWTVQSLMDTTLVPTETRSIHITSEHFASVYFRFRAPLTLNQKVVTKSAFPINVWHYSMRTRNKRSTIRLQLWTLKGYLSWFCFLRSAPRFVQPLKLDLLLAISSDHRPFVANKFCSASAQLHSDDVLLTNHIRVLKSG